MPKRLLRNIVRFVTLVLVQVLIMNHIQFSGYINPYIYILFILLLPFETPNWLLLLLAFILGLSVDIFSHTIGMHAIATTFMAFLRPYVLDFFAPRDDYDSGSLPRMYFYGFNWFIKYSAILVFAHHLVLFYTEIFRLSDFFSTFLRVIISSAFSILFIIISQYFVYRK